MLILAGSKQLSFASRESFQSVNSTDAYQMCSDNYHWEKAFRYEGKLNPVESLIRTPQEGSNEYLLMNSNRWRNIVKRNIETWMDKYERPSRYVAIRV